MAMARAARCQARAAARPQPLPRVDPAFDFAVLLELSFARVLPAFESADFDGLEDLPPLLPIPVTSFQMQFYWNSSI